MKRYTTAALAALASAAIGGLTVQAIHAQAKPPVAYHIAEIDVANLSRSQLEQRAQAAGIDVTPGMTKKELAAAIRASAP